MGIIAMISPLGLTIILFCAALALYRIQAAPESRAATALVFIFASRFIAEFINGFSISRETGSVFGQLDTVSAYVFLAFAILEVILLEHATNWQVTDLWVIGGLFGLGFLNLIWKLAFNAGVSANDLLYILPLLLFLALRPTSTDLRFLPYFGVAIICMVAITALLRYQNPLFPYFQNEYGLNGPYQNRVWGFFGLEERFRGPYPHPNQLGIAITFLSLLTLLKTSRLYIAVMPISFTLLFLASSRTSILALMAGVLLRIYLNVPRHANASSSHMKQAFSEGVNFRRLLVRKAVLGFSLGCFAVVALLQIIQNNSTGSGRLENNRKIISAIRDNLLIGKGPSIFSVNNTENTVLTILSFYGVTGLALVLMFVFALILKFKKIPHNERYSFQVTLAVFLVASSGELLLSGTSRDTGLFYLIVLLTLTRRCTNGKAKSSIAV